MKELPLYMRISKWLVSHKCTIDLQNQSQNEVIGQIMYLYNCSYPTARKGYLHACLKLFIGEVVI